MSITQHREGPAEEVNTLYKRPIADGNRRKQGKSQNISVHVSLNGALLNR